MQKKEEKTPAFSVHWLFLKKLFMKNMTLKAEELRLTDQINIKSFLVIIFNRCFNNYFFKIIVSVLITTDIGLKKLTNIKKKSFLCSYADLKFISGESGSAQSIIKIIVRQKPIK